MTSLESILMWALKGLMGVVMAIGAFVFTNEKKARERSEKEMKDSLKELKEKQQSDIDKIKEANKKDQADLYDRIKEVETSLGSKMDDNQKEVLAHIKEVSEKTTQLRIDLADEYQKKTDCLKHAHETHGGH